jgi:hypothetical protein
MRVATVLVVILIAGLTLSCAVMTWNECRRIHAWWYCIQG